ncbi:hypothetical protein BGX26_004906, partial [Mortierella sp. AD094]
MTITFRVLVVATVALLLQGGTNAASSSMTFYENSKYRGSCVKCDITEYQKCYQVEMKGLERASSALFHNRDPLQDKFSLTYYTGKKCGGDWFRASIPFKETLGLPDFLSFNGKIQSFKVANFPTSTTTGRGYPSDATVRKTCRK